MNEIEITNMTLFFLLVFIIIPVCLSYYYSLGLSRSILWSAFRGISQLLLIGYILTFLFGLEPLQGIPLMLAIMIMTAALHAAKKGKGIPYILPVVLIIMVVIEGLVLALWLSFQIIDFEPDQVIPMSGMVIGNSMVAIGLALDKLKSEMKTEKEKILASLALGASPAQATQPFVKRIIRSAMIPNIDGLKTIGIVQLPGMMTGLILGGVSPLVAVRFQIVISLSIFVAVSVSAMLAVLIIYRFFFNSRMQLIERE
ncbi:ABC transporter permease [Bacillus sp. FJAT-44742]|uniref:ABC transporter permease n=1 Tax=Bacillus sp. FJAT-44742 TaxID=2014005 RepID=UPI000C24C809|nr:iron export ABC transporter permease subunit FetB [Bacillus sp. FJAT-44742]